MKLKRKIRAFLDSKKDMLISPKRKFTEIYKTNHWGDSESHSGPGSKIEVTENVRRELENIFVKFGTKSIIDAPCGDFNWMRYVNLDGIEYTGIDIVEELITVNNAKYAKKGIKFILKNILKDELPTSDIILCRDLLAHLSNSNIQKAVINFVNSGSEYLLTTNYTGVTLNTDIITGSWRKMNLQLEPFNFPEPVYVIDEKAPSHIEGGRNYDKTLFMWKLSDLKNVFK